MKATVVQPPYYAGSEPDKAITEFLTEQMRSIEANSILVLPEYSNAGGLSDRDSILNAVPNADKMLRTSSESAKRNSAYIAVNVLEERNKSLKNSTYLFDKEGNAAFVYDKVHLPPPEIALGIEPGNGECFFELDGIRFAFMTCYDVYFSEQIEFIAKFKPDVIIVPGYQRGERVDIIRAQAKLLAFRCNAYVLRSSYSMNDDEHGGCSMIVLPDGIILEDMGKVIGSISADIDVKKKYMRSAGFGGGMVRNDDFISGGMCSDIFGK